jgi:hypothetical protein
MQKQELSLLQVVPVVQVPKEEQEELVQEQLFLVLEVPEVPVVLEGHCMLEV